MDVRPTPYQFHVRPEDRVFPPLPAAFRGAAAARPLTLTAADTDLQVDQLSALRLRLNVPFGLVARGLRLSVLVNPKVTRVSRNLATCAPLLPEIFDRAAVKPAELVEGAEKIVGVTACYQAAERGQEQLRVSRGILAKAIRLLRSEVLDATRHLLTVPDLKPELRARIQATLLPIEVGLDKQRAEEQKRRSGTISANQQSQADLERLAEKEVLLRVMEELRGGRSVDPVAAAQALRTHDELKAERAAAAAKAVSEEAGKAKKPRASNRRTGNRP